MDLYGRHQLLWREILKLARLSVGESDKLLEFIDKLLFIEKSLVPQLIHPQDFQQEEPAEFMSNTVRTLHLIKSYLAYSRNPEDDEEKERLKWNTLLLYTSTVFGMFIRQWKNQKVSDTDIDLATDIALRIIRDLDKHFFKSEDFYNRFVEKKEDYLNIHRDMIKHAIEELSPTLESIISLLRLEDNKAPFDTQEMTLREELLTPREKFAMAFALTLPIHLNVRWNDGTWQISPRTAPAHWPLRWILHQKEFITLMLEEIMESEGHSQKFTHLIYTSPVMRGIAFLEILRHYYAPDAPLNHINPQDLGKTLSQILDTVKHGANSQTLADARQNILKKIFENLREKPITGSLSANIAAASLGLIDTLREGEYEERILDDKLNLRFWIISFRKTLESTNPKGSILYQLDLPQEPLGVNFLWQRHMVESPLKVFQPTSPLSDREDPISKVVSIVALDPRLMLYSIHLDESITWQA